MSDLTENEIKGALLAAVDLGVFLERDIRLATKSQTNVLVAMARREALRAMAALPFADPENAADIRRLQNEVHRFLDMRRFIADTLAAANEAAQQLTQGELDEVAELLALEPEDA